MINQLCSIHALYPRLGVCCSKNRTVVYGREKIYQFGGEQLEDEIGEIQSTRITSRKPQLLTIPPKITIVGVSCSDIHALAWDSEGYAFSWGFNSFLQVNGFASRSDYIEHPTPINQTLDNLSTATCLATNTCSFAITNKGELFSWGKLYEDISLQGSFNFSRIFPEFDNSWIKICGVGMNYALLDSNSRLYTFGNKYLALLN